MSLLQTFTRPARISLSAPEDFARFYEHNHLSVFRYLMVLCAGDRGEAEELTAEAFYRAWEKRGQFTGSDSAALGWLIIIARNLLIDRRRAAGRHAVEVELDDELLDPSARTEDLLVDADRVQQVIAAVQSLPYPYGDIVTLRYVLGWQVQAIAYHLGMPENTVSVDLRRALARLQKKLVPQETLARRAA